MPKLSAFLQIELLHHFVEAFRALFEEKVHVALTFSDHAQETAARMNVILVFTQMSG